MTYAGSWLVSSPSDRLEGLDECCASGKKAIEGFERIGDELNHEKICNTLPLCFFNRLSLASSDKEKQMIAHEGIDLSSQAIAEISELMT